MLPLYPDKRKAIAGEFFIQDSRIRHRSRKAFKKIQTWKKSVLAPDNEVFQQQVENQVRYSFFQTVSVAFILLEERYYDKPLEN